MSNDQWKAYIHSHHINLAHWTRTTPEYVSSVLEAVRERCNNNHQWMLAVIVSRIQNLTDSEATELKNLHNTRRYFGGKGHFSPNVPGGVRSAERQLDMTQHMLKFWKAVLRAFVAESEVAHDEQL